ncbi:putative mitochondrial protein [Cucumis melo var. makuwa]|uniref:Putative mitochondrial protein n=1 Tax=Cucumis melo var. makuwa TaxID=1194695 RepID=A0A5D3DFX9_CUCMM|nr:putative mitochondrial protein [Cucumis melo var. makuwa]
MDLCKELVWRDPTDGRILGQRPIPSLMEVCSEIRLEEDRTSAMNISTTPSIDSVALMREHCLKLHGRPSRGKKHPPNDKHNTGWAYVSESAGPSQPSESQGNQIDHGSATLDGSLTPIAGKGKISICAGLFLNIVLHDLSSGKMIVTARHSKGLHLLDDDTSSSSTSRTCLLSSYFITSEQDCSGLADETDNWHRALLFSALVHTPLKKIGMLSVNIATFLTRYMPSFFPSSVLKNFGSTPDTKLAQSSLSLANPNQPSVSNDDSEPTPNTPLCHSIRVKKPSIHLQDYHCFSTIVSLVEPNSYQEASIEPLLQKAMNDELQALEKTYTWDYVDLPPGKRPIRCKWIYKIKIHSDGTIERYKARLVAKGYSQEYGIDYEETFASIARMTSVRSLLAVATANSTIIQLGFASSSHDTTLFTRQTPHGIVLLLLYVDDMIITGIIDSNTALMPLDPNVHLILFYGVPLKDVSLYQQLVGNLIYLTVTRPDIAYVVHIVIQFMAASRTIHFTTILRYYFYLGDSFIAWHSKKQSVVSYFSTESEYHAFADGTAELMWLHWLLADMGVLQQGPTLLHRDNRSAI